MASSPLTITVNRQTKQLAAQFGGVSTIPDQFQGDSVDLTVYVTDTPIGAINAPYSKADMTGFGMRVSIGDTPTGTAGGPTPLALATLTYDSATKSFNGSMALNTTDIDTFLGSQASKTAYFEIKLTNSGNRSTVYQGTFLLKAVVDEVLSIVPTPTDQYLTRNECLSMFLQFINAPGVTVSFTSPDNHKVITLNPGNDGILHNDVSSQ